MDIKPFSIGVISYRKGKVRVGVSRDFCALSSNFIEMA